MEYNPFLKTEASVSVSYRDVMCTDVEPGTLATGDAVVLARYDVTLYGDQVPVRFYIREFRLWLDGGTEVAQQPSSGDWELPVAVINGPAPVATQGAASRCNPIGCCASPMD